MGKKIHTVSYMSLRRNRSNDSKKRRDENGGNEQHVAVRSEMSVNQWKGAKRRYCKSSWGPAI